VDRELAGLVVTPEGQEKPPMKVVCDRAALLDAVNLVAPVVAVRSPRPQLSCVKLSAVREGDAGELRLAATDADVSISLSTAHVDVQQEGDALIPADKLRQIVQAEDAEDHLTIETTGESGVEIRGQDAKFTVYGFPPDEFPPPAAFPEDRGAVVLEAGELQSLISRTLFATSKESSRYAINGVLVNIENKKIELVATDGRRLALASGTVSENNADKPISAIIPTKALSQVGKLLGDPDERVRLAITENQAVFALGEEGQPPRAVLSGSLVEGAFPPYQDVIPKDQDKKATFEVSSLTSAVRRAALLTNEESRGVRLKIARGGDEAATLHLSSRAPEMGEASIDLAVPSYEGEEIEIGFNPQFITDALKVVQEPQVVVELKAPNRPGVFRSGSDFTYVVMPVNLQ
jgi:DNA polymerase-3 subunit beta